MEQIRQLSPERQELVIVAEVEAPIDLTTYQPSRLESLRVGVINDIGVRELVRHILLYQGEEFRDKFFAEILGLIENIPHWQTPEQKKATFDLLGYIDDAILDHYAETVYDDMSPEDREGRCGC